MNWFLKGLLFSCLIAAITAIYVFFQFGFNAGSIGYVVRGIAVFGCFGFLLGGIYAFDAESKVKEKDSVLARVGIGIVCGLVIAFLLDWPTEAYVLSALVGAMLGYLGMIWAKYVDF